MFSRSGTAHGALRLQRSRLLAWLAFWATAGSAHRVQVVTWLACLASANASFRSALHSVVERTSPADRPAGATWRR